VAHIDAARCGFGDCFVIECILTIRLDEAADVAGKQKYDDLSTRIRHRCGDGDHAGGDPVKTGSGITSAKEQLTAAPVMLSTELEELRQTIRVSLRRLCGKASAG
jgi:hypothetical protein